MGFLSSTIWGNRRQGNPDGEWSRRQVPTPWHLGGGRYVSVTSGFLCVDFRKWFKLYGRPDIKPSKNGIALRLCEWADMRRLIDAVNNDHPTLAVALPCYMSEDHNNQLAALDCRECNPFFNWSAVVFRTHTYTDAVRMTRNYKFSDSPLRATSNCRRRGLIIEDFRIAPFRLCCM